MSADILARGLAKQAHSDAASFAKSANTRALVQALRNYGFYPQPQSRTPANNVPVVALGAASAASAINGRAAGNPLVLLSDNRIKWLAGPTVQDGSGAWTARGAWYGTGRTTQYGSCEFVYTGSDLEICLLGSFASASNNLRVLIDDRTAALATVPNSTGSYYYLRLTFPAAATRRIRIEGANGKFRGINVASGSEVSAAGRTYPLVTLMGDSFPEATGASPMMDGEGAALVRALGGNIALGAVGGTGLLNPGSGGKVAWTDPTRLTDLTMAGVTDALGAPMTPALGIVMMSINDQGVASALWSPFGSSFKAAISNRVFAVIDAWLAANPGKPLVFIGPTWPNGDPPLDVFRIRDACFEACWAYAGTNVWFIDRLQPMPLLRAGANSFMSTTGTLTSGSTSITAIPSTTGIVTGAGIEGAGLPADARVTAITSATAITVSSPATASAAGAALVFRNSHASLYGFGPADGTHPGQAGHTLDALWMAQALRNLILTEFA